MDPKPAVYSESSLPDSPEKVYPESSLPDSPEKVNCPKSEDISVVCVVHFPEAQCLEHKFFEASSQGLLAPSLPRITINKPVLDLITSVNDSLEKVLEYFDPSLQQCVHLLYAAAATVNTLLSGSPARRSHNSWKSRLENTISILRGDLSRLVAGGFPPSGSKKFMHKLRQLHSKHCITSLSDFSVVIETLKQKISGYAARLRKYKSRLLRQWQNKLFRQNEKRFYSELLKGTDEVHPSPDLAALESFWKNIFENPAKANLDTSWLSDLEGKIADRSFIVEQSVIDEACFNGCVSRLRNWDAPGPDGVQGFWIKRFTALRSVIVSHFNNMLN